MIVDSYKFLPRSFRPLYEGRGPLPGQEGPVWAPFGKRLAEARIGLLTSAGMYLKRSQPPFDVEAEKQRPEWGDPGWRSIPSGTAPDELAIAHLHINEEDLLEDPEIALPMRLLSELAAEGMVGGAVAGHVSVMGFQDRRLRDWQHATAPEIVAHLREQAADGLVLAPA